MNEDDIIAVLRHEVVEGDGTDLAGVRVFQTFRTPSPGTPELCHLKDDAVATLQRWIARTDSIARRYRRLDVYYTRLRPVSSVTRESQQDNVGETHGAVSATRSLWTFAGLRANTMVGELIGSLARRPLAKRSGADFCEPLDTPGPLGELI